jgi:hypothetical protein
LKYTDDINILNLKSIKLKQQRNVWLKIFIKTFTYNY